MKDRMDGAMGEVEVVRKPARRKLGSAFGDDGLVPAERHQDTRGALLVAARVELDTRVQFAEEIRRLWTMAEDSFVQIGRHLNSAKERLAHGEFMEMAAADLPFTHRTANRLMTVARALDAGALPVDRLPPSYATIYEVLTLTGPELERATAEGLIRPDLKRDEVTAFRRRVRTTATDTGQRRAVLETERRRLEARLADILAELDALD